MIILIVSIGVNAAGVTGVRTPQYLTCRGPSGIVELDLWKGGAIANPDDMI